MKHKQQSDPVSTSSLDSDLQKVKDLLEKIQKEHSLGREQILDQLQEHEIPISIYNKELSPLETTAKYLKENQQLTHTKIAQLLGRSRKTIWQAYSNASKKVSGPLKVKDTRYVVPISVLNSESKLSVLEATVKSLREKYNLSYRDIGRLLQRNERTIWTAYSRAQKKGGKS